MKVKMIFISLILFPLAQAKETVAVLNFTDTTEKSNYQYTRGDTALVQSLMDNLSVRLLSQFRLVERQKLSTLVAELEIHNSGMIKEDTRLQIGEMTGASLILTGSITELATRSQKSQNYGVTSTFLTMRMVVVFKLVHLQSGELMHAGEVVVKHESRITNTGSDTDDGYSRILGRKAADKIAEKLKEYKPTRSTNSTGGRNNADAFTITIESRPTGAHVDIDGFNEGATPLRVVLPKGIHHIKISQSGFEDWSTKFRLSKNRAFKVVLERKNEVIK